MVKREKASPVLWRGWWSKIYKNLDVRPWIFVYCLCALIQVILSFWIHISSPLKWYKLSPSKTYSAVIRIKWCNITQHEVTKKCHTDVLHFLLNVFFIKFSQKAKRKKNPATYSLHFFSALPSANRCGELLMWREI